MARGTAVARTIATGRQLATFNPLNVPSLVQWYDWNLSPQTDNTTITSMTNRASNGSYPAVAAGTPKYRTNGIQFPTSSDYFDISGQTGSVNGTLIVVGDVWSTADHSLNAGTPSTQINPFLGSAGLMQFQAGTGFASVSGTWARTKQSYWGGGYRASGGALEFFGTGVPVGETSAGQSGLPKLTRFGGPQGGYGLPSTYRLKHVLVFSADLLNDDPASFAKTVCYLTNRDFTGVSNAGGRIIIIGDSMSNQAMNYYSGTTYPWFRTLATNMNTDAGEQLDLEVFAFGIAGQTCAQALTDISNRQLLDGPMKSTRKPTVVIVRCGTNDLAVEVVTATTAFNRYVALLNAVQSRGMSPLAAACVDRSGGFGATNTAAFRVAAASLNTFVTNYCAANSIPFADLTAGQAFGVGANNSADASLFADTIHKTTLGYTGDEAIFRPFVKTILGL